MGENECFFGHNIARGSGGTTGWAQSRTKKLSLRAGFYVTIAWKGFFTQSQVLLSSTVCQRFWSRSKNSQSCIIRCKNSRLRPEFLNLIIHSCSFFKQYLKEIFKILPFEANNRSWLTTLSRAATRLMYTVYKAYRWSQHTSSKPNSIALHVMSNNLSFNWFWLKLNK